MPKSIQHQTAGPRPNVQAAYALAVYLFAPLAIIVPLTVSSAVGSQTIIGERERGSGEFLAHSPASEREIFVGKLIASLLPGYLTAGVGFLLYSLIVNLIVGPQVGGWFFPTANWWILVLWVVPPFLALVVGIILRISSRVTSAAAAQQASALVTLPLVILAYGLSTGSLSRARTFGGLLGLGAWICAVIVLWTGARAAPRTAPRARYLALAPRPLALRARRRRVLRRRRRSPQSRPRRAPRRRRRSPSRPGSRRRRSRRPRRRRRCLRSRRPPRRIASARAPSTGSTSRARLPRTATTTATSGARSSP